MTDTSATVALLAFICAVWAFVVLVAAKLIERRNPPMGSFVEVEGVTFHYFERGRGPNVVFLHGNATMLQDFVLSDAFSSAAAHCRALAFDRPGFGYSTRPLTRQWTPTAQADLLAKAIRRLGCERAVIVGHSWGTLTALALAQRHPELVRALVLLSGLYYPRPRLDALLAAAGAMPVLGDILRYTLMPLAGLLTLPLVRRNLFAPAAVPEHFRRQFPWLMTLRP